jgi:hypothetical protein
MAQVRIFLSIASAEFPAGTLLGKYRFQLMKGIVPNYTTEVDLPLPPEIVFDNVAPGDYTLKAQQLNAQSSPIGSVYTQAVSVAAPPPVAGVAVSGAVVTVV